MRVLFDSTFPARNHTGIGVYGRELLAALRYIPHCAVREYSAPGMRRKQDLAHKLLDAASCVWGVEVGVLLSARRHGVDVIHSPAFISPLVHGVCPVVVTIHDTILEDRAQHFNSAWRLFHRVSVRRAAQHAAAIIVPTNATKVDVAKTYCIPEEKLTVVPYGVNRGFRPQERWHVDEALLRLGINSPYMLFVGAQVKRKNITTLVHAFAAARHDAALSRILLILAGPCGDATELIRKAVQDNALENSVRFLSGLTEQELVAVMNGAMFFVFPSLHEGGGLPPLEAMACGTPVLAAASPAVKEMLGDAAEWFDGRDVVDLTRVIWRAVRDVDLRTELRNRGLERAAQFSWAKSAEKTLAVYEQALSVRGRTAR